MATKIALIGVGKIAQDQHIPALHNSTDWELAATVSRRSGVEGVENFQDTHALLEAREDISVVSLCMPPAPRFLIAKAAIEAGRHVMLEKPPGATLTECQILAALADKAGVSLYTTWHSREAAQVDIAQAWLADKQIKSFSITWKEDVRRWHPGQEWIWQPGGLGVFDPGINALSILTKILPEPVRLTAATLQVPSNKATPIAVDMSMTTLSGAKGAAEFDFRQEGEQIWEMEVATDAGVLQLKEGGGSIFIDNQPVDATQAQAGLSGEYPRLYDAMHKLLHAKCSEVDLRPMQLVADACLIGRQVATDPFEF